MDGRRGGRRVRPNQQHRQPRPAGVCPGNGRDRRRGQRHVAEQRDDQHRPRDRARVAGLLIVTVGVGECFILNALSFLAVIIALMGMNPRRLVRARSIARQPGQLVAGLRYVRHTPRLLVPLLMMGVIGALSYEFQVVLPVLAQRTFHGNADAFGSSLRPLASAR
jgi:Transmembrane secretion effector